MLHKAGRVIVVTGANKGIGYSIVEGLVKFPDKLSVILTARDEERGKEALKKLLDGAPEAKDSLHYHHLDVTKKESVNNFVEWAKESFGKIDVLVNNAAVNTGKYMDPDYKPSEEDFRITIDTNFEAVRNLTYQLFPLLSEDGKIINVSSGSGTWKRQGEIAEKVLTNPAFEEKHFDELSAAYLDELKKGTLKESGYSTSCYGFSKALLNAWTHYVLAKKLKGDQQTFTVCPGWCKTDMGGEKATRSAEKGAETVLYLIELPYKRDPSLNGLFLRDKAIIPF